MVNIRRFDERERLFMFCGIWCSKVSEGCSSFPDMDDEALVVTLIIVMSGVLWGVFGREKNSTGVVVSLLRLFLDRFDSCVGSVLETDFVFHCP